MSRTIRRNKNNYNNDVSYWEEKYIIFDIFKISYYSILLDYYTYNKKYAGTSFYNNNKQFIKDLNRYHTDNSTEYNAPKKFKKQLNKKYRLRCKKIIKNSNNYNNLIFPLQKKSANWEWF